MLKVGLVEVVHPKLVLLVGKLGQQNSTRVQILPGIGKSYQQMKCPKKKGSFGSLAFQASAHWNAAVATI